MFLELHQSLIRSSKLRTLARKLDIERPLATGLLVHLWLETSELDPMEGTFCGARATEIAELAGWRGDADEFVAALIECRLVDADADGRPERVHNWEQYTIYFRRRIRDAKRKRAAYWKKIQATESEQSTSDPQDVHRKPVDNCDVSPRSRRGVSAEKGAETPRREEPERENSNLDDFLRGESRGESAESPREKFRQPRTENQIHKQTPLLDEQPRASEYARSLSADECEQLAQGAHRFPRISPAQRTRLARVAPCSPDELRSAIEETCKRRPRAPWAYAISLLEQQRPDLRLDAARETSHGAGNGHIAAATEQMLREVYAANGIPIVEH